MDDYIKKLENKKERIEVVIEKKKNKLKEYTEKINKINEEIKDISDYKFLDVPRELNILYCMQNRLKTLKKQAKRLYNVSKRYVMSINTLELEVYNIKGQIEEINIVKEMRKTLNK